MIIGHMNVWIKPEFGTDLATVDMHVARFSTIRNKGRRTDEPRE
jgi:hypothetical protein